MVLDARSVPPERVRVVPHGGPTELLPAADPDGPSRAIGAGRSVLATFGLISPGNRVRGPLPTIA